jgi:hypothetical protein
MGIAQPHVDGYRCDMIPALEEIPQRILHLALGALTQANTHAVFSDPGNEHWEHISVLNTAHAGELFLKAIIAREHPLLIFKDLFGLDDSGINPLDVGSLIQRGRTHDFEKLPHVLWVTTGKRVPNMKCFERLRRARNAIQHFCAPVDEDFRSLSLEFIYTIIDPLIAGTFDLCAIKFHEDDGIGYDYVVQRLLYQQLKFTMPDDFRITEIIIKDCLEGASKSYRAWVEKQLTRVGRLDLLD